MIHVFYFIGRRRAQGNKTAKVKTVKGVKTAVVIKKKLKLGKDGKGREMSNGKGELVKRKKKKMKNVAES